jgi:ribosomal protein S3
MIDEYEKEWQQLRGDILWHNANRNRKLIEKWCQECGVTSPIGYENDLNGVMTIYTEHPGALIGRGGEKIDKFKEELKQEFGRNYEVKFVEVRGGFVNVRNEEEM